jgi:hypothetical protein
MSRLYGGIHFRCDLDRGNEVGRKIGEYIIGKLQLRKEDAQLAVNKP